MPIYYEIKDTEIEVTGDTYTKRHLLKSEGARWDAKNKAWTMPVSSRYWVENTLDAVPRVKVVEKEVEKVTPPKITRLTQDDHERIEKMVARQVELAREKMLPDLAEHYNDDIEALAKSVKDGIIEEVGRQNTNLVLRLDEIEARAEKSRVIEVKTDRGTNKVTGLSHPMLETLITSLAAGLNVWIAGPSGSGKTYGAMQAAEALGLKFEAQGAMTMAHELTGFVDANGTYHETPFVRAFKEGGLILLDEIDAGSNEALLCLNSALANGFMSLPNGEHVKAHDNFKCIGAANTFGHGATAEYVGRVRIDAAFLQRFGARLDWGYDEELETKMTGNDEWSARVQAARAAAKEQGLKVMITPRQSQA